MLRLSHVQNKDFRHVCFHCTRVGLHHSEGVADDHAAERMGDHQLLSQAHRAADLRLSEIPVDRFVDRAGHRNCVQNHG